jgi:hypothetical protein
VAMPHGTILDVLSSVMKVLTVKIAVTVQSKSQIEVLAKMG